jgi:putative ABC transport system substrate-binding protein
MRRRKFISLLGGAAAWPIVVRAQQSRLPVVGFVNGASPDLYAPYVHAWRQGLSETGYAEGRNVAIEYRWAMDQLDRVPALVAELVRHPVVVLAATGTPAALAAKAANTAIPIVFTTAANPVELGLVASLARPGSNITGVTQLHVEVGAKKLELLHELLPSVTTVALLLNRNNPALADPEARNLTTAAHSLGIRLEVIEVASERDFDKAFAKLIELGAGGLVIGADQLLLGHSEMLADLALRHAISAVSVDRKFVTAGGLMSYGGDVADAYRLAGIYTGRILKGDKPADLPVQQATKVELHINLKTAKALGLTVPTGLLLRATEVIE